MRLLFGLLACLAASHAAAWDAHEGQPLPTSHGEVVARAAGESEFALTVDGKPAGTIRDREGRPLDVAHLTRVLGEGVDYVLVDVPVPGLRCRHVFAVLELATGQPPRLAPNFGECHELEWARVVDGRFIVLLEAPAVHADGQPHEVPKFAAFLWRDVYMDEIAGPCESQPRALALLDQLRERAVGAKRNEFGQTVDPCAGFVRDEDLPGLLARLDSKRPALGVMSALSSSLHRGLSTEGHEAAYLIQAWREGVYPPTLDSRTWSRQFTDEERAEFARIGAQASDP